MQAIKAICEEKHISVESVLATIEQALAAAYRKDFGNKLQNLKVEFNPSNMQMRVFDVKTVVEDQELPTEEELRDMSYQPKADQPLAGKLQDGTNKGPREEEKKDKAVMVVEGEKEGEGGKVGVPKDSTPDIRNVEDLSSEALAEDEEKRFNPKTEIMISEAQKIKPDAQLGEEIITELPVAGEFGRMAAQTAKQVIIQRLREAERDVIFKEYKDKEGAMVNGSIQRIEGSTVLVDIGQATAVLPPSEQVRSERYAPGTQMRFYIKSVSTSSRGPEVLVSRADRELVRQLFAMEVPEISDNVVEIKAIAREPGSRTKIAVATKAENVDPVGSCVGQRGSRVQFVINELGGEKIDIIQWEEDEKQFIKSALSPAKVVDVALKENSREAEAFVIEDQLSLAIGKQGQNVRLASALTGWKINIKQAGGEVKAEEAAAVEEVKEEPKEEAVIPVPEITDAPA